MKKIKSIWGIIIAMAFSTTACQQDDLMEQIDKTPTGEYVNFNIQRGWDFDKISRSANTEYGDYFSEHELTSEDQSEAIKVQVYQKPMGEVESRGTMVQKATFNAFTAYAYKTTSTSTGGYSTDHWFTSSHSKTNGSWNTKPTGEGANENGYYWPGAGVACSFYGLAMSDDKLATVMTNNMVFNNNSKGQINSFTYTVPAAAADQPDIMFAADIDVDGSGSVNPTLDFKHILSAVNVKVGTTMQNGTIQSITFKNIYGTATYNFGIGNPIWSGFKGTNIPAPRDFSVAFNGTSFAATTGTAAGTQVNAVNATLMMIPQTLPSNAAIEISFLHAGSSTPVKLTADIGGTSWGMGVETNYLINISKDNNLMFTSTIADVDAHYVIVPFTIKAKNLSMGWTMTAEATNGIKVTLKETLSTLQAQGYWTVNELGDDILSGNEDNQNDITVYAFVEENNSTTTNNTITLTLKNTETGAVAATKTFTQLCMSSVRSERKEETSYVPWGFKWDRKVIMQVTPGLSLNFNKLFGAILFQYTANNIIDEYGATDYVTVDTETINLFGLKLSYNTKVTIDYSKIPQLSEAFNALDGHANTSYLYNFKGVSAVSQIETYLRNEAQNNGYNYNENSSGNSDGESIEKFAAKSCAMKNKYFAEIVTQDAGGGTVTYPVAVLSSDETSSTNDNFNYLNWYLPAKDEYNAIETAETNSKYQLNGVYWTSTAVANDNVNSYTYTAGTGQGTDDRMATHLVRCKRK